MSRYMIKTGKFGQYFYDIEIDKDMALITVLAMLNNRVQRIKDNEALMLEAHYAGQNSAGCEAPTHYNALRDVREIIGGE